MNKKIVLLLVAGVAVAFVLIVVTLILQTRQRVPAGLTQEMTLEYWRVFDDDTALDATISEWNQTHPNIKIHVVKKDFTTYKDDLIDAWARGEGPDLFQVHNSWVTEFQDLITPAPTQITLASIRLQERLGGFKKDTVVKAITTPFFTEQQIKRDFVQTVFTDAFRDGKIYGIPYAIDTLALFVNDDHLAQASIPLPATTYDQLIIDVPKLTTQSTAGEVIQSGMALGTATNINRASDILSLLMMQNGTTMVDADRDKVLFHRASGDFYPGVDALRFYSDFSNPAKKVYSWTSTHPQALDAFAKGNVSMFFGYAYQIPQIRASASSDLNFSIHPVPQISGAKEVNFANYWLESVAKQSEHPEAAWGFIQFAADSNRVARYVNKTQKPSALKALIDQQQDDLDLAVFARQALTAKNWYQGNDASAMEQAFQEMIDGVSGGNNTEQQLLSALELAAQKIETTYSSK